jgi:hypothetical protein
MPSLVNCGLAAEDELPSSAEKNPLSSKDAGVPISGCNGDDPNDSNLVADESDQGVNATDGNNKGPGVAKQPKKRKVTPTEDSESRQSQQKKVNQLSLSSFFLTASGKSDAGGSPLNVTSRKKRKHATSKNSVLEELKSPQQELLDASTITVHDEEMKDVDLPNSCSNGDDKGSSPNEMKLGTYEGDPVRRRVDDNSAQESSKGKEEPAENNVEDGVAVQSVDVAREQAHIRQTNEESPAVTSIASKRKADTKKKATKLKNDEISVNPEPPKRLSEDDLPKDRLSLHQKFQTMKKRYLERNEQLISQARGGVEEEDFERAELAPLGKDESLEHEEFPTGVVANLALLIEGR